MIYKICDKQVKNITGFIFDIKKYAIHDGPGIRTTIFFKGCPLQCKWCHNPESWRLYPEPVWRSSRCTGCGHCENICQSGAISFSDSKPSTDIDQCTRCGDCVSACLGRAREIIGETKTVDELMADIKKDIVFYDESGGGVTVSGGEPLMQPEFLLELLETCKDQEIHTALDTTCYCKRQVLDSIRPYVDLFLCDIKHMDPKVHKEYTGVDNKLILENIRYLADQHHDLVIRMPVIPGFNDTEENITATAQFAASLPDQVRVDVLPYNSGGVEKSSRLSGDVKISSYGNCDDNMVNSIVKGLGKFAIQK